MDEHLKYICPSYTHKPLLERYTLKVIYAMRKMPKNHKNTSQDLKKLMCFSNQFISLPQSKNVRNFISVIFKSQGKPHFALALLILLLIAIFGVSCVSNPGQMGILYQGFYPEETFGDFQDADTLNFPKNVSQLLLLSGVNYSNIKMHRLR